MKNLSIAVIAAAVLTFVTPFANATDDVSVNDTVVKIFAEAIDNAERAEPHTPQVDTQSILQPQAIPAVLPLFRLVFSVEAFRLLLDTWDHVVNHWEFYRERIISDDSDRAWLRSCSVASISETPEVPEVILHCPDHPAASPRSESG